jgi:hypothetical protein
VVTTIPQDAFLAFALAQGVALSAARSRPLEGPLWQRPFQEALLFLGAIFLPASYSFFHFWPDWSWLYAFDTQVESQAYTVLGFVGVVGLGALGFVVARALLRRGRRRWVYGTLAGALAVAAAIGLVFHERFLRLGTYDEFAAGAARPLYEVGPFAAHMGVVVAFLAAGLLVIVWGHRRRDRTG